METFKHIDLRIRKVKDADLAQALRGQKIPRALAEERARRCVIRGIRYHHGFGTELRGLLPEFNRALNARSLGNEIPDMNPEWPEEFPYCIWHPETASEAAYRKLAKCYPHMKYLVGRACAVAGYTDLFHELDLLPECHIAEEARESGHMAIYDAIMKATVKYNAMNHHTREIFTPVPGNLNGDMAIRSYFDIRFSFNRGWSSYSHYYGLHWAIDDGNCDINEDRRVDEYDTDPQTTPFAIKDEILPMLYSPLPPDLPTLNKDLLIMVAAFCGDIDRYSRLRRPKTAHSEFRSLVRGIYNNTMFAKWCSLQTCSVFQSGDIKAAINARFIMNGDLSRITADTPDEELSCHLVPIHPTKVARILANYEDVYDLLDVDPDTTILQDARDNPNPHYLKDMEAKVLQQGCRDSRYGAKQQTTRRVEMFEYTAFNLARTVTDETPLSKRTVYCTMVGLQISAGSN